MNRQLHMPKKTTSSTCATASVTQSLCHYSIHVRVCALMRCDFNGLRIRIRVQPTTYHSPSPPPATHAWEFSLTSRIALATFCTVSWAAYLCICLALCVSFICSQKGARERGRGVSKHSVFSSVMFARWLSTDRSLFTTIQTSCRSSPWIYYDDTRICLG